ncbi:restriction endonuclease subunit S [Micromonospora chersina]|uniref:restriction endonuclease subunit S n=1 Tax=Micromonospora chersina TaxID=47854 RepID=UPI00378A2E1F
MTMENLPTGWSFMPIARVLRPLSNGRLVQQGWSPQCHNEPSADTSTWGVLKTTAIQAGEFLSEHNKRLPDSLAPEPLLEVSAGDLLLTAAGPRARCAVPCLVRTTRPRLMISGKMYRFRADESVVDPRFLEFFLLNPNTQSSLDAMKTGISDSGLNLTQSRFLKLNVVVPPIEEQLRIVNILEDHLSRLDAGNAELQQVVRRTASLRAAVVTSELSKAGGVPVSLGELSLGIRNGIFVSRAKSGSERGTDSPDRRSASAVARSNRFALLRARRRRPRGRRRPSPAGRLAVHPL